MRIAVSVKQPSLEGEIDPRFGRCQYFLIVEPETMEFEVVENPNVGASGGAGIMTAKLIADKQIQAIITGSIGPNASRVLSAAGIQMVTGVTGKIRDAIEAFKSGRIEISPQPGIGRGMGMGMAGGRGMGRGPGFAPGMARGLRPETGSAYQLNPGEEISDLKHRVQSLAEELAEIQRRIKDLEKKD
ncbi:MAG: NifB/NifX family molybdenum-iron cluster-binding protein [Thermodesulfobacteriota bacterium]